MVFHMIDIIIGFSAVCLFGVITKVPSSLCELPSYYLKDPEIVISITNYNNTFTPPIFSFTTLKTKICLISPQNINTNNIICNDYIKCPSKMEAGEVYILYCSCDTLSCSFEEKKTDTFWVATSFLGILSIIIIFIQCCEKN